MTENVNITATEYSVSSFSFDISPLSSRKNIFPDAVSFDTTGRVATTTPVPAYTRDFTPWDSGYPVNGWNKVFTNQPQNTHNNYIQASQFPHDFAVTSLRNKFLICGMTVGNVKLDYGICDSPQNLVNCNSEIIPDSSCSAKAFALVVSSTRAYCFWLYMPTLDDTDLQMSIFNGSSWSSSHTGGLDNNISPYSGVSGCLVKNGSDEYIAVAYPTAANNVNILSFKDGNYSSTKNITSGIPLSKPVTGAQITITQNPRSGKVYLAWISDEKAYYKVGTFSPGSGNRFSFDSQETEICSVSGTNPSYACISAGSYNNFETSFVISDDKSIENYCICGDHGLLDPLQVLSQSETPTYSKFAMAFQYFEDGYYYSGCICLSAFRNLYFLKRKLEYPQACSWQPEFKKLHIEGPPRLNTKVNIQVKFAEMIPDKTFARCVNSDFLGGVRCFDNTYNVIDNRAVIASASVCFFALDFDKSMNTSLFPTETNSFIKLKESGTNNQIALTNIASTSGKLVFKPSSDLKLNTDYVINIASGVVDAIGSQIYKDEILYFKTQLSSTPLDPEGVIDIEAFSDSSCSVPIASGSDVVSNKKLYLRVNAYDPAFNTIDTTTVEVKKDGSLVTTLTLTQKTADSQYFYGEYQLSAPLDADSEWIFQTENNKKYLPIKVTYPVMTPLSPASGTRNLIPGNISGIEISASEELDSSSVNSTNVKLLLLSAVVPSTISYNNADKKIVITPNASLDSEKNYYVSIDNIFDKAGNKQLIPLVYNFSTKDTTPPSVTGCFPSNASTNVTIDSKPYIVFSEEIAPSVITKTNFKITCNNLDCDYLLAVDQKKISFIFNDGLKVDSLYRIEVSDNVTDYSGNHLTATYNSSFNTQPKHTEPITIDAITLYNDSVFSEPISNNEKIKADTRIYIKLNGVDGATQTTDIATVAISLNGAFDRNINLIETASDSGGIFTGSFDLNSLSFTNDNNTISFASTLPPNVTADVKTVFPGIVNSSVNAINGSVSINDANDSNPAYISTRLILVFSDALKEDTITADSLQLASGTENKPVNWTLSEDKKTITITPLSSLPYNSDMKLSIPSGINGIKNETGNAIRGNIEFNFKTQKEKTEPTDITEINIYSDSSYSATAKVAEYGDFKKNGTVFIEARGIGSANNTIDNTSVIISSGTSYLTTVVLTETSEDSCIFRGEYICSFTEDWNLNIKSEKTPAVVRNLALTTPRILSVSPANGTVDVPIAINMEITLSEPINETTINNIKLEKITEPVEEISYSYNYNSTNNKISIVSNALAVSTMYRLNITGLQDIAGNTATDNSAVFTTQNSKHTASDISGLEVYRNSDYSGSPLSNNEKIIPNIPLWVKVTAGNQFYSNTYVTINVKNLSIPMSDSDVYNIEATNVVGSDYFYQGMIDIPEAASSSIEISVGEDSNYKITLITEDYPVYKSFLPASGTAEPLYLNNEIVITTNKTIDDTTVNTSNIILEGGNPVNYGVVRTATNTIKISINSASEGDHLKLTLTSAINDISNMPFPITIAEYLTKSLTVSSFKVYSDSGCSSEISANKVETGQTVYCKILATDLNKAVNDTIEMRYSVNGHSGDFNLVEESEGIYTGHFDIPNYPDSTLSVWPVRFDDKKINLSILEAFALVSYSPEDKAEGVPVDVWPIWNFNKKLSESQLTDANFSIYKNGVTKITGSLILGTSGMQVRFQPVSMLEKLSRYEMRLSSDIEDINGKKLGTGLVATFTTQPPPLPPSNIFTFANYSDDTYSVESNSVAPSGNLFLQLVAEDTSFSTYESTRVFMDYKSGGTYNGVSLKLIETNPPSGIFRLIVNGPFDEGSTITLTPQADSSESITVSVNNSTKLVSLIPASGSSDIYLDTKPSMIFSSAVNTSSMPAAVKVTDSNGSNVDFSYSFESSNKKINIDIIPGQNLKAGETYYISTNNSMKDSANQPIQPFTYKLTTKRLVIDSFNLYTDSGYTNKITNGQDIEPGVKLYCEIKATDMTSLADQLEVVYSAADASNSFTVNETGTATGIYRGNFEVPGLVNTLLNVYPKDFTEKVISLDILSAFMLESYSPSENATNVPADVWPIWNFSRRIPEAQLTSYNFALYKVSNNQLITGSLSLGGAFGEQVRFKPDSMLEKLTEYKMVLSAELEDSKGKKLGVGKTVTFTTQPPPLPPTGLIFENYANADYLNTTNSVIAGGKLYLQIKAENTDISSQEKINVIMDSDDGRTYIGESLALIETSSSSKIFRLTYLLKPELEVGTKLTLIPQSEPAKQIVIDVIEPAVLVNVNPASGSENIYLDTEFSLNFSNRIDGSDLQNRIKLADAAGSFVSAGYSLSSDGRSLIIKPSSILKAGEKYSIYSTEYLVDNILQPVRAFNCNFTTKYESDVVLELYTGIAPCDGHKVSETSEIVKGQLGIYLTTSDMLEKSIESRILHLSDMNYSIDYELTESALNSNLYVATVTVGNDFMRPPMKAEVMFGPKYQLKFDVATKTTVVSISPSENEKISGNANINAVFSRKMYVESAKNSTKVINEASSTIQCNLVTNEKESNQLVWKPKIGLSSSYFYNLTISGLKDYLGLDIEPVNYNFYCGNEHNIYIYSDYNFTDRITTEEISNSEIYVEVVASSSVGLAGKDYYIDLLRGTATETLHLKLSPVEGSDRNFRCCLKLADTMSSDVPAYALGLYPGEWVKLSSPLLTSHEILFYYRFSSGTEPEVIKDMRFFSEKTFVRRVTDEINNPSLYIEVEAEDLNWLTEDVTRVLVTSDDDHTGFVVELNENGTHSDSFRGMITLSEKATDIAAKTLKVSFGNRITVTSLTNPNVRASIRYFPKAEIIDFIPYPSPARGNHVNFRYYLNFPTGIKITIFDVAGHKVDTIETDGREGENRIRWNFPRKLANGTYIYRVKSMGTGIYYTHAKMVKGKFAVLR